MLTDIIRQLQHAGDINLDESNMPKLEILVYPHPFLKTIAKPVKNFDSNLKKIASQMIETMYQSYGIGLAATQVGIDEQMFVMDVSYDPDQTSSKKQPEVIINPVIKKAEGGQIMEEGCLSVPGHRTKVKRHAKLTLEYQDLNRNKRIMEADGLAAVCIQHEFDHLQGKLFIDRLPLLKKKMIQTKLKKKFAKR